MREIMRIYINRDDLLRASKESRDFLAKYNSNIDSVNAEVINLNSSWQGKDYDSAKASWNTTFKSNSIKNVKISLENLASAFEQAERIYREAQEQVLVNANKLTQLESNKSQVYEAYELEDTSSKSNKTNSGVLPTVSTSSASNANSVATVATGISKNGVKLIGKFEGCRLTAYKAIPSEKYYTIGYGHNGPDVSANMKITQEQAEALLAKDVERFEKAVRNTGLKLNQNQFDALVSFTYNLGEGCLNTLIRNRTLEQIGEAMLLYNKAGGQVLAGLVRRRQEEHDLFFTPC